MALEVACPTAALRGPDGHFESLKQARGVDGGGTVPQSLRTASSTPYGDVVTPLRRFPPSWGCRCESPLPLDDVAWSDPGATSHLTRGTLSIVSDGRLMARPPSPTRATQAPPERGPPPRGNVDPRLPHPLPLVPRYRGSFAVTAAVRLLGPGDSGLLSPTKATRAERGVAVEPFTHECEVLERLSALTADRRLLSTASADEGEPVELSC